MVRVHAENLQTAFGHRRQAGDHAHRRGLPCAVRAEEAEDLAPANREVHGVDGREGSEPLRQPAGRHHGVRISDAGRTPGESLEEGLVALMRMHPPETTRGRDPLEHGAPRHATAREDRAVKRVSIVGNSGSGKTTLGRRIAEQIGAPFVELDAIVHQPGWEPLPTEEFRAKVAEIAAQDLWVVDGNYSVARDILWDRADSVVWFDLPRRLVMVQVVRRTLRRTITREAALERESRAARQPLAARPQAQHHQVGVDEPREIPGALCERGSRWEVGRGEFLSGRHEEGRRRAAVLGRRRGARFLIRDPALGSSSWWSTCSRWWWSSSRSST